MDSNLAASLSVTRKLISECKIKCLACSSAFKLSSDGSDEEFEKLVEGKEVEMEVGEKGCLLITVMSLPQIAHKPPNWIAWRQVESFIYKTKWIDILIITASSNGSLFVVTLLTSNGPVTDWIW